jgi:hypothetical protein
MWHWIIQQHINNEFKYLWKEAVMACFKVLSQLLNGGNEDDMKNLSHDSQSWGWELILWPPWFGSVYCVYTTHCGILSVDITVEYIVLRNMWHLICIGFMQFKIAIVSIGIYSCEIFVSWTVNMWLCVCVCVCVCVWVCVEDSMTVTVKYKIKGITHYYSLHHHYLFK